MDPVRDPDPSRIPLVVALAIGAVLMCGIIALTSCAAQQTTVPSATVPAAEARESASNPLRLIATGDVSVHRNWFEDEYAYSSGDDVKVSRTVEGTTTSLLVRSRDMAGISVRLDFKRDGESDPALSVLARWRRDSGARGAPRSGDLEDVGGMVLINSSYADRADPLMCRFFITGRRSGRLVTVAGAVSANAPRPP